jgi:hypothetical protein
VVACIGLTKEATCDDCHTSICSIACGASTHWFVSVLGHLSSSATKASVSDLDPCPLSDPSAAALGHVDCLAPLVYCPLILTGMCIKSANSMK